MTGWTRPRFAPGGADAFLAYAMLGNVPESVPLPKVAADVPGLSLRRFTAAEHASTINSFLSGPDLKRVGREDPELALKARGAATLALVTATVPDPGDLLYLRRLRHTIAALIAAGATTMFDAPAAQWWRVERWRSEILAPAELSVIDEVIVHVDEQDGLFWVHTRGMRKFGRPDLSMHDVPRGAREQAETICRAAALSQIEGERIVPGVPYDGFTWESVGGAEDPAFDNAYIAASWH
ncbi:MAG: hypothetical protein OER88_03920 [Planctomycetota bacterium]|nr:hypothetical protein [Planctomycetota bacterium]